MANSHTFAESSLELEKPKTNSSFVSFLLRVHNYHGRLQIHRFRSIILDNFKFGFERRMQSMPTHQWILQTHEYQHCQMLLVQRSLLRWSRQQKARNALGVCQQMNNFKN